MFRPEGPFTAQVPHVFTRSGRRLTDSEFRIFLNLLSWVPPDEDECWVYVETLAHGRKGDCSNLGCGCSARHVRRVLRSLERKGAILRLPSKDGASASRFRIRWEYFDSNDTAVITDTPVSSIGNDNPVRRVMTGRSVDYGQPGQEGNDNPVIREKTIRKNPENEPSRKNPLSAGAEESDSPVDSKSSFDTAGPANPKAPFDPAVLDHIYNAYPRKVGRAAALKSIQKALHRVAKDGYTVEQSVEFLLDRVACFAASPAGQKGQYTPHPATWFNQDRFLDDEQEWLVKDRSGPVDTTPTFRESGKFTREF